MRDLGFNTTFDRTFTVRRIERDIIINKHTSSCKVPVFMVRDSLKLNFLNRLLTNSQVFIFKNLPIWSRVVPW